MPVILAGDFNVVPTDRDIYATRSYAKDALLQRAPRARFARLLEAGWRDAIRVLHPDAAIYTYWSYLRNRWPRDAGLRIDHLLLSAPAAKRLVAAGVDRAVRGKDGASDHAPVWVELRDAAGRDRSRAQHPASSSRGAKATEPSRSRLPNSPSRAGFLKKGDELWREMAFFGAGARRGAAWRGASLACWSFLWNRWPRLGRACSVRSGAT